MVFENLECNCTDYSRNLEFDTKIVKSPIVWSCIITTSYAFSKICFQKSTYYSFLKMDVLKESAPTVHIFHLYYIYRSPCTTCQGLFIHKERQIFHSLDSSLSFNGEAENRRRFFFSFK